LFVVWEEEEEEEEEEVAFAWEEDEEGVRRWWCLEEVCKEGEDAKRKEGKDVASRGGALDH
jgi:hypothetical protein